MTRQELLSSVELNSLIRAYKGMLKIQTALIKYNFQPENIEDNIPEMSETSYEILCKMAVAMNDLLTDIHDICEEVMYEVNDVIKMVERSKKEDT